MEQRQAAEKKNIFVGDEEARVVSDLPQWSMPTGLPDILNRLGTSEKHLQAIFGKKCKLVVKQYMATDGDYRRGLKELRRNVTGNYILQLIFALNLQESRRAWRLANQENPTVPVLEYLVLRKWLPGEKPEYEPDTIRQLLPWYGHLEERLEETVDQFDKPYLMSLPAIFERVGRWNTLTPAERDELEIAVFCAASIAASRTIIDKAIMLEPAIEGRFRCLDWLVRRDDELPPDDSCDDQDGIYIPGVYALPGEDGWGVDIEAPEETVVDTLRRKVMTLGSSVRSGELWHPMAIYGEVGDLSQWVAMHRDTFIETTCREIHGELDTFVKFIQLWCEDLKSEADQSAETLHARGLRLVDRWKKAMRQSSTAYLEVAFAEFWSRESASAALITEMGEHGANYSALGRQIRSLAEEDPVRNAAAIAKVSTEITQERVRLIEMLTQMIEELGSPPALRKATGKKPADEKTTLKQELAEAKSAIDSLVRAAEDDKKLISDLRGELKQEKSTRYQAGCEGDNTETRPMDEGALRVLTAVGANIGKLLRRRGTVLDVLTVIRSIYPEDRCLILESAWKSAEKMEGFRNVGRLFELLGTLSGDYVDALRNGAPDSEARNLFGGAYHANESETRESRAELTKALTFRYGGEDVMFTKHLAIGVASNKELTARVHFHWDADRGRVVIGYVGHHL